MFDDHDNIPEWEERAEEAVSFALAEAEFDREAGVIRIPALDDRGRGSSEEFTSYNDLFYRLVELADNEWYAYVPFDGGEAVFESDNESHVGEALDAKDVETFFAQVGGDESFETIITADEMLAIGAYGTLRIDVESINAELIAYLARHPEKMHDLQPRKFEELVAELFKDMGYDVELTPATCDGGFDVRAIKKSALGTALVLIECKRYAHNHPVGVEVVRGLYSIVAKQDATRGIVATTSRFTRGAKKEQQELRYRMSLADHQMLVEYCQTYRKH